MSERMRFVLRHEEGERMTDLCLEFGISRKTGYKLLERYNEQGPAGLFDLPRRPHRLARQTDRKIQEVLIASKHEHPTWGPRKLLAWLGTHQPGVSFPAASTVGELFGRHGLVKRRRLRKQVPPHGERLRQAEAANDICCVDYKGQFRLGNAKYCYPLTVTDQFSRYVLACEGFEAIDGRAAQAVFDGLFTAHGIPSTIRSDNGAPFASRGLW